MSDRKRKGVSLAVNLNRIETHFCVLCKTGLVVKNKKREFSLGKLIDIAFTLRKVISMNNDWIESTFTKVFQGLNGNVNSELLLCSECLRRVDEITKVVEELVELSGDILNLKRKLFPGKRNRRSLPINCDEETGQSCEKLLSVVEDTLGGDDFHEPLEASENESDKEEPAPKRPCIKNTVAKMKALCSSVSRRKGKRSNQIDSYSSILCPCCKKTFPMNRRVGGRTGNSEYANLCRHLVSCSARTPALQCDKCDFQSEDIRLFCEHLGACEGQPLDLIPIEKQIINCEMCYEGTYFSFEAYFRHCVFHKRYSYKCMFPDPSNPSGICSERSRGTTRSKHWAKHISDPMAALILPDDRFKLEVKMPTLYWFCHLCNDRFTDEEARNSHLYSEHSFECKKRTHQCNFCASSFLISEDLSTHSILEHPEYAEGISVQVKCDHCGDIFKSKKVLQQHIKSSHQNLAMPCSKCGDLFHNQKDYIDHMKKTHGVNIKLYDISHLCPECNLPFQQRIDVTSHLIREHKRTDLGPDPLLCVHCEKPYANKRCLQVHISLVHKPKSVTFCEKCGEEIKSKFLLKKHMFNIHGEGDLPTFKCEYSDCGKIFNTKQQRRHHYESQHLKTPSISCEHCGQTFYRKKHFRLHTLWHRHPGFRAFTCELCPTRRFKLREHLIVHWRTHTPEEQEYLKDFGIRKEEMEEFRAVYQNQKEPNPECFEKTKDGGILLGKKLQSRELTSKS